MVIIGMNSSYYNMTPYIPEYRDEGWMKTMGEIRKDNMQEKIICSEKCRFCNILEGTRKMGVIDNPILENDEFFTLVSVGGFVEGWSLVIPKEHTYSMRKFYTESLFVDIADKMLKRLREVYGKKCIIFEHGANHEGSITACGTNHAHLHMIPYEKSLLSVMFEDCNIQWIDCKIKDIYDIVQDREYWFYAEDVVNIEDAKGYIHIIEKPESQYFRRLLGEKEGYIQEYDYKSHLFVDKGEATYASLVKGYDEERTDSN